MSKTVREQEVEVGADAAESTRVPPSPILLLCPPPPPLLRPESQLKLRQLPN